MRRRVLIVDDEKNTREGLRLALQNRSLDIRLAADGEEALQIARAEPIDLVLADLKMPRLDGLELLKRVKQESPGTEVVILTGHGTIASARDALKQGAYDYLTKPVDIDELSALVDRVLTEKSLREENFALRQALNARYGFESIIGQSAVMQRIFQQVRQVAPTRATVLLTGESGTGKELIARAIHQHSDRVGRGPFVPVNCGALAPTLLESELFGHERGAFTSAVKQKPGRFELAHGGTLFLDEISETSLEFQVKLLRVIETGRFERVGGTEIIHSDVRIIAASNRDLEQMVADGSFRSDLYYRLKVISIVLPPLRERREDIPLLAQAFLAEFSQANGKNLVRINPAAMAILQNHPWPGNVRQLKNAIEGAVIMAGPADTEIGPEHLPADVRAAAPPAGPNGAAPEIHLRVGTSLDDAQREIILATLQQTGDNRARTARLLGLSRKTLYRKMEEYGIDKPRTKSG
ncbi:MAG: sigma-54 dependent transcriptional regulator [Candidatus Sumerlaeia bacterium]|nr:sigma-54 dependent transcriptional regulator [Candidatus Sumerlaeia bacterium]